MIEQIAAVVAQNESIHEYEIHVSTAPLGGYDTVAAKSLVTIVAQGKSERVFVKISNSEKLSYFLQNEAESMDACAAMGIKGIPQILGCGFIEGRYFLAQRYVPGSTLPSRPGYLNTAMAKTKDWLGALGSKTSGHPVESAELVRRAREYAWRASDFFDLADCLGLMERLSPRNPIPTSRIHGDFWHRNILLQREEVYVTDFAFSAPDEPPIDYLDLISDYDSTIFLDAKRLQGFSKLIPIDDSDLLFLHVYAMIRKIGLKTERRKALYDELLLSNLEASMNEISEVGIAKQTVRNYENKPT